MFDRDALVSTNHDQFLCSEFVRFDTLEKIHKTHILLSLALHEHSHVLEHTNPSVQQFQGR